MRYSVLFFTTLVFLMVVPATAALPPLESATRVIDLQEGVSVGKFIDNEAKILYRFNASTTAIYRIESSMNFQGQILGFRLFDQNEDELSTNDYLSGSSLYFIEAYRLDRSSDSLGFTITITNLSQIAGITAQNPLIMTLGTNSYFANSTTPYYAKLATQVNKTYEFRIIPSYQVISDNSYNEIRIFSNGERLYQQYENVFDWVQFVGFSEFALLELATTPSFRTVTIEFRENETVSLSSPYNAIPVTVGETSLEDIDYSVPTYFSFTGAPNMLYIAFFAKLYGMSSTGRLALYDSAEQLIAGKPLNLAYNTYFGLQEGTTIEFQADAPIYSTLVIYEVDDMTGRTPEDPIPYSYGMELPDTTINYPVYIQFQAEIGADYLISGYFDLLEAYADTVPLNLRPLSIKYTEGWWFRASAQNVTLKLYTAELWSSDQLLVDSINVVGPGPSVAVPVEEDVVFTRPHDDQSYSSWLSFDADPGAWYRVSFYNLSTAIAQFFYFGTRDTIPMQLDVTSPNYWIAYSGQSFLVQGSDLSYLAVLTLSGFDLLISKAKTQELLGLVPQYPILLNQSSIEFEVATRDQIVYLTLKPRYSGYYRLRVDDNPVDLYYTTDTQDHASRASVYAFLDPMFLDSGVEYLLVFHAPEPKTISIRLTGEDFIIPSGDSTSTASSNAGIGDQGDSEPLVLAFPIAVFFPVLLLVVVLNRRSLNRS